jgi:hypothetical protein
MMETPERAEEMTIWRVVYEPIVLILTALTPMMIMLKDERDTLIASTVIVLFGLAVFATNAYNYYNQAKSKLDLERRYFG